MALRWENYCEIADALNEAYPEQPLLDLGDDELLKMVTTLPGFEDTATPTDERVLPAIWNRWVSIAYPDDETSAG